MKKIFFHLVILSFPLFLSNTIFASDLTQRVAQEVQTAYESLQDLQMNFKQETYVQVLEKKVQKEGLIKLKKPKKFLIQYESSRGKTYLSNGKKLWVFRKSDRQPRVFQLDDENVPSEALTFLGGLGKLNREFAVESVHPKKWKALKAKKGKLNWLELTPLKKQSQIAWLVMGFDPQTHLAQQVFLFTDSGNLSHYQFSEVQPNKQLKEDLFEFR